MKPFQRAERVGCRIKEDLSDLLVKRISDPRLAGANITGVKVTSDLKLARVYYFPSPMGPGKEEIKKAFAKASGFIRKELAKTLNLKYMPDIEYLYDEAIERGRRIDEILSSLKEEGGTGDGIDEENDEAAASEKKSST